MKAKFAKLISSYSCFNSIKGVPSAQDIERLYLDPVFKEFIERVSADINNAKFNKRHIYQYEIKVYAQEQ